VDQEALHVLMKIADTLEHLDDYLAGKRQVQACDFDQHLAFAWRKQNDNGYFHAIQNPKLIKLDDLKGIDAQKSTLMTNTEQFLAGYPANNALLWGAKGTGKSSVIKGLLERYAERGLRVIEIDRKDLVDIPDIVEILRTSDKKFILFCDDLSFEAADLSYKALKVALDGGMTAIPDNILIYATSNRRHLLPEMMEDNLQSRVGDREVHYADAIEEKISLSERFGIWLSFYLFSEEDYLHIVRHWVTSFGIEFTDGIAKDAIIWARLRASKSGRSAYQYAIDLIGKQKLGKNIP
jgi:hypothetical protein